MNFSQILINEANNYNIELNSEQVKKFDCYKELLIEWNEKINLTTITDDEEIAKKHFLDSVSLIQTGLIKDNMSIIDVGTGAGFPGIPLKIIKPDLNIVLVDSLNKRINFLNTVIDKLSLKNIKSVHGRAEDVARNKDYRQRFDIATARAVSNMTVLSEYCIPFLKTGGYFLAMKGPSAEEECNAAKNAIGTVGGKYIRILNIGSKNQEFDHKVIIVEKVKETLDKYPRKAGLIEKKPLI